MCAKSIESFRIKNNATHSGAEPTGFSRLRSPTCASADARLIRSCALWPDARDSLAPVRYFCCMPVFTDQMGLPVSLAGVPERIVSLVPSQSEFLWDLGLRRELVGITKFCIHPAEMFSSVTRIGGTKKVDLEKVAALK